MVGVREQEKKQTSVLELKPQLIYEHTTTLHYKKTIKSFIKDELRSQR